MKKFTFKGVLDGFRQTVQTTQSNSRPEQEIQETLRPEHFQLLKTFRHGFPHAPTSIAYDPVQKLLVIGDKSGSLRFLGQPGVDIHLRHEGDSACAVTHLEFLVNDGSLVSATADDTLHLWNFRQKNPQVVQSLKFQRERITCLHLPVASKWLYVGTEKGNIHVVHIETFALSGYIINWNKAIEVLRRDHPGAVVTLADNPLDSNKLLIAFECGQIVLWDMRGKCAEIRWQSAEQLRSVAWHHEGKYFISSHTDGSLCTWPLRPTPKPQYHSYPHAKTNKDGKLETCKPIHKVDLRTTRMGETFTIFSGGISMEKGGKSPCITVLQGKSTTVLEMEHPVVDFVTICESPWSSDTQEPYAIAVLLQNDLVLIDLLTPGFPCFESPYPMDLHESPVTCCTYLADCPPDLVPAFFSIGRTANSGRKSGGFSERKWPISGGDWSPASCSYSEIIITGHQDGSIKFWDSSAGSLLLLYKLKTAKIFERPRIRSMDGSDEDPLAVQMISLCAESRRLCIAGASGHVILFKFRKVESSSEFLVLEIPIFYDNLDEGEGSPECEFIPRSLPKQPDSVESEKKADGMLKVRQGPQRKPAGFQAQIICLTPWTSGTHPGQITALCINSSYGLMAYGNEHGLVIVDIVQKICLLNVASPDLYGTQDPYSRTPRSPKRIDDKVREEQARSPSIDQLADLSSSPQKSLPSQPSSLPPNLSPTSRPVSPALEAEETTPTTEFVSGLETEECIKTVVDSAQQQPRRKSSSWKGFNLKRQISKVNLKISNTFTDAQAKRGVGGSAGGGTAVFYCVPTDGTPLSPVEISPDTNSNVSTEPSSDKSDYLLELEKNIVQSLSEVEVDSKTSDRMESSVDTTANNSDSDDDSEITNFIRQQEIIPHHSSAPKSILQNVAQDSESYPAGVRFKERTMSQPQAYSSKRVDFTTEEPIIQKTQLSPLEGCQMSRPSDLPLYDDEKDQRPIPPPRTKRGDGKRDQRLLSVPNIKYHRQDGKKLRDLRPKTDKGEPSGSFAGNLIRRFTSGDGVTYKNIFEKKKIMMNGLCGGGASIGQMGPTPSLQERIGSVGSSSTTGTIGTGSPIRRVTGIGIMTTQQSQSALITTGGGSAASNELMMRKSRSQDKFDNSFSRSRSSSMSSLENIASESVTCLAFADSYTKKSDPSTLLPTLWVGTSLGSVLTVSIILPETDNRKSHPVVVSILGGPIFRLKGSILSMSFLDCNGALIPYSFEPWKDENRGTPTKNTNRMSPTLAAMGGAGGGNDSYSDRQFIAITSEKQARVVALPSQNCVYRQQIGDTEYVVKAEIISLKDSVCLICYISTGHLFAYSLPSLRPLMDEDFLPLADLSFQTKCKQGIVDPMLSIWGQQLIVHEDTNQISKTFCFSNRGHGLYLATPSELQKFTVCNEFCQFINEMVAELYLPQNMPEPPKENFFKGLFGGGQRNLDREELFGETSGKPNRSIAKHIPGPNLQELGARAGTAASEISRAHQLALERGEKLSQLEDRAERMSNQAQEFGGTAHNLMLKYKDKKWYHL